MVNSKILIVVFAVLMFTKAHSQSILSKTIQWNVESIVVNGVQQQERTTVVSYGTDKLEWKNTDGSLRKKYTIVKTSDKWPDTTVDGYVRYEVTDGSESGVVMIQNRHKQIRVTIAIGRDGDTPVYRLFIENFTEL